MIVCPADSSYNMISAPAADIIDIEWCCSLGVVIWEIATGEVPMRGNIMAPECPRQCPCEVAQIVEECMRRDPAARPSPKEVFR